ncbi:asparagine synthase (glutamine-hydrolyzing) [Pseudomonas japonica]|uniref:asparagine synthase (glutamine-hydrolyzing) n=1 Tax=Pseudomonas japonica TaxID=256466 RepID=A0A239HCZ1_9PSED|nr:asparagine synthase (glutamine-hydrolyzing) [Pseudomonas japonica]SNS79230.1 asparagine synthase (glutamine-hydrolysing) [Pseudomonas japonica]
MCGFAGLMAENVGALEVRVQSMLAPLFHRGPDDEGIWIDERMGLALGHRRLAILDLSAHGHQPMHSTSGRYVIVFNGEIYNFALLRKEIEAAGVNTEWRGHSDTEVLLAAFELWGVETTLARLVGMFAIVLWDKETHQLTLARDRLGEKPLYFGRIKGAFYFASELKAIRAQCAQDLQIDRDVLADYMRFGYIPAPRSIYKDIFKLHPGHLIQVSAAGVAGESRPFWSLVSDQTAELRSQLSQASDTEVLDLLDERLASAVGLQSFSDVPVGAFLSGGVDSSLVVSLMQAQSSSRVRTFTIGFEEEAFNEAPYAREVAQHLGTDHTEMYVKALDAAALIPMLPKIYDEPFADSSQIPTTLVSRLTREHVTVALTGDGGDELFAGYPRYPITANLWRKISKVPRPLRSAVASVLTHPSAADWDRLTGLLPARYQSSINGRRVNRLGQLIDSRSLGEMYIRLMSHWQPEENIVVGGKCTGFDSFPAQESDSIAAMRQWDVVQHLPDDLLVKVDRATMYSSLESRAPLLDHRIAEFAFALPERFLVREGVGKWALRRLLDRYVPSRLIDRPKTGFSIPLGEWLRGPLRDWAEDLLSPSRLVDDSYLDADKVGRMWHEHLSGKFDRSAHIWNVLMFQAWLRDIQSSECCGQTGENKEVFN